MWGVVGAWRPRAVPTLRVVCGADRDQLKAEPTGVRIGKAAVRALRQDLKHDAAPQVVVRSVLAERDGFIRGLNAFFGALRDGGGNPLVDKTPNVVDTRDESNGGLMMAKPKRRKLVSVPTDVAVRLERLRADLQAMGIDVTLGGVIERGMSCLEDAHRRHAWLSPAEQAEPLKQRVREAVVANIIALREQAPESGIIKVHYDQHNDLLLVDIEGRDEPIGLYPDSPHNWQPPASGATH